MSSHRIVPVLSLGVLVFAVLVINLQGKKNQTFDGVIVQDGMTYEFFPNAKGCDYWGMPYVVLPDAHFKDFVTTGSADIEHLDRLFHGTWRARLNGNVSRVGWYKYRKAYLRELSVNYVVDAMPINCSDSR